MYIVLASIIDDSTDLLCFFTGVGPTDSGYQTFQNDIQHHQSSTASSLSSTIVS